MNCDLLVYFTFSRILSVRLSVSNQIKVYRVPVVLWLILSAFSFELWVLFVSIGLLL